MLVNICCSGSSGSTFLCQQLDRHPEISCGAELNLFSKLAFYDRYKSVKRFRRLIRKWGISSNPYSEVRPVFDNLQRYGLTERDAWGWLVDSSDIVELAKRFEDHVLGMTGKNIWAEKTPRNIRVISRFVRAFPGARIVHIVRDPRDVVLSLMNRGFSFHKSAEVWLAAVLAIQPYRTRENVFELRYEDLVTGRMAALEELCRFIGVDFDEAYFQTDRYKSRNLEEPKPLSGWQADPRSDASVRSIQRHRYSDFDFGDLFTMRPTAEYARLIGVDPRLSIVDLIRDYGYEVPEVRPTRDRRAVPFEERPAISLKRRLYNLVVDRNPDVPKILV